MNTENKNADDLNIKIALMQDRIMLLESENKRIENKITACEKDYVRAESRIWRLYEKNAVIGNCLFLLTTGVISITVWLSTLNIL